MSGQVCAAIRKIGWTLQVLVTGVPAGGKALQRRPSSLRSAQPAEPPGQSQGPGGEEGFFAMMSVSLNYPLADSLQHHLPGSEALKGWNKL